MNFKTVFSGLFLLLFYINVVTAQSDTVHIKREYVAYTFFYNVVPNQCNYPLVGFLNVAKGNHKSVQLGFVNTTLKNFTGLKAGFINTTLGNVSGVALGFINTTLQDFKGCKMGFVNTTIGKSLGVHMGFVNTLVGNNVGVQLGFVNTAIQYIQGFQLGFVNTAAKGIKGSQLGFINIADSVSNGIPIGFLSIVKKGGYRGVEISVNELYSTNIAFKIGVPQLYSFFQGSYQYNYSKPLAVGFGFGSLIPIGTKLYVNPEIGSISSIINNNINTTTVTSFIRYAIHSKLQIAAGPSVVWQQYPQGENMYDSPFFSLFHKELDTKNTLLVGARVALSFTFTDL